MHKLNKNINRNARVKLNSKPQHAIVQQKQGRSVEKDHKRIMVGLCQAKAVN